MECSKGKIQVSQTQFTSRRDTLYVVPWSPLPHLLVEGALLLALLAGLGRPVSSVAVVAAVALAADEGGDDATVLTGGGLPVPLNVL